MPSQISLEFINNCSGDEFIANLGGVFEHSPWVAENVLPLRPFASIEALHRAMVQAVDASTAEAKLTLIRNHPELAGKEAEKNQLTAESTREQKGAGLDQCSKQELQQLRALNQSYQQQFGFPFVIAVSGLNRQQILQKIQQRLSNEVQVEIETSIQQIAKIAQIRLQQLIAN